ncbi:MAG TPA: hypothetical protein VLA12_19600, partial [Planctomycetaceae bacterium]|nr:hypothetical protein [Planctomycetaceae bacterium]
VPLDSRGVAVTDQMAVFIDEIHQANMQIEQCLLKALEPNDRMLVAEDGREMCTRKIVFMFATTDRGDLFDALDTRTVKVNLRLYSRSEVAQIVHLNYPKWSLKACELVAKFCGSIPREALAFARDMEIERKMTGETSAVKLAEIVRQDHRIDEHGLTQQRLDILTALGQAPISRNRLGSIAQCKDAELQKFILPALLAKTPDREQPLITVSSKGYTITPEGLKELTLRKIPNQGIDAIPKSVRCLFPLNDPEDQPQAADSRPLSVPFKRNA